ncbi:unnamed protein product [Adineta steineri]|uniref:Uncharacterized protein n=1 Tax=Adineta steineri TaxID=433720 RepID=A0A814W6B8_9BILA|nr:unnamed protein product [Adineta steineri]
MFRVLLFFSIFSFISLIDIKNFIPFGLEHNDKIFEKEITNITDPISISVRYSFFNTYYDTIRISSNGLIVFGNNSCLLSFKTSDQHPFDDLVCIAPYWIDTNLTYDTISNIFYREILLKTEPNTLYDITKILRNGFPKLAAQRMLWAFVITWYELPDNKNDINRNTYQVILTTNGFYSFSLFTYHQLQWSQGLSGNHAQIGFNAGDQINYYRLKRSLSPEIINIVNESNIGIPGQFIFHTTGNISDVQCETSTGLQISPFRGSIYGGYEIRLHGICFNQSHYEIHIDDHIVDDCRILNSLYIVCTMPMLMDSGKIKIELFNQETKELIDSTDFLGHVPEDHGELILSNYINLTQQIADPNNDELILHFQSNSITQKYLFRIIIYDYATQLSSDNQTLYNRTRQRIDLGLGYLNLSAINNLTIRYDTIFSVTTDPTDRVHALQISFEIEQTKGWLRSALFVGAKIFTAATTLNAAYCPAWLLMQSDPLKYIEQVPVCPCQVPIEPWIDEYMGFRIDEGCDARKPVEETCAYHKSARGCYRKRSDISWAGAQCCYDEQGKFIEHGKDGAGTLDVISPDANSWYGKSLNFFGHFFSDFLSYWSCCRSLLISETLCKAYYDYRPAGRCENMEIESIEKHGDPYFVTLNGSSYTFQGQGEYTLLSLPEFNGQEVQIRLASNDENVNKTVGIVAFVIGFLKDKKRVQFELFPTHQHLEIRIDTRLIELPHEEFGVSVLIYEDEYVKIKRKVNGAFKISFPGSHFRFRATIRPNYDFFDLETLLEREKFNKLSTPSYGLLGDLHGLMYPNGTRVLINESNENTLFEYGQSWRVSRNTSLFYYLNDDINHQFSFFEQNLEETNKMTLVQSNCNNDLLQEQEHCTQDISQIDSNELNEDNSHDLYRSDQHHWESLTVTIAADVIPQKKSNSAIHYTYSYSNLFILVLYFFL